MLIFQTLTAVVVTVAASLAFPLNSHAQSSPSSEYVRETNVDAHRHAYPLLSGDVTREEFASTDAANGPMNTFVRMPDYPSNDFKGGARSHLDTLYSIAWLDLTKEPLVVAAPSSDGRVYLLPMLDMWSDLFTSPGWRTTDSPSGRFLVTPPGWSGAVPAGMSLLSAPTPYVWIISHARTDGAANIQAGYSVTPLSQLGRSPKPLSVTVDQNALTMPLYGQMAEALSGQ